LAVVVGGDVFAGAIICAMVGCFDGDHHHGDGGEI
jgi:hypothetical protein